MNKLAQKIELASHVAIIIVAILLSVVLVKNYLLPDPGTKSDVRNNTAIAGNKGEPRIVGERISLPNVDWKRNGQTLVFVLSAGCGFCRESASFYKELVQKRAGHGSIQMVAVLPQPVDAGRKYLSDLGVSIEDVRELPPSSIGLRGVPTLLLVNKEGVVTDAWHGKLPRDKELEVLARL